MDLNTIFEPKSIMRNNTAKAPQEMREDNNKKLEKLSRFSRISKNPTYVSPSFFYGNGAEETYTTQSVFDTTSEKSPVGKSFKVTGYLARYFEKFQIQLGNNYGDYNYLERL